MEDTYLDKGLRRQMINEIKVNGFHDELVLEALENVPRHFFFPDDLREIAYRNKSYPIGYEQTISQPYTVAIQSSLLEMKPYNKVLEVGTGSGYQAAVLAEMKARVFTIERIKPLFDRTIRNSFLKTYNNLKFFYGDGNSGLIKFQPYDKILITAACDDIPKNLLLQLKIGGIMVFPKNVENDKGQEMIQLIKKSDDEFEINKKGRFIFVPMLKGKK